MRTTTLLRQLLGFPGIIVESVSVQKDDGLLVVQVKRRGKPRCSRCGKKCPGYDHLPKRRWRHLDYGPWRVFLEAALARVSCPSCGVVVVEAVSFAVPGSGFTKPFEDEVGWLLQRCDKTMIATFMRIAWRTVGAIAERVVDRLRTPIDFSTLRAISVDELSWRKGHRYITIVTNLETGRVIWTGEGKSAESLAAFFQEIGTENCARIRYAAIDMSAAYTKAIGDAIPNAQIVYDRFHVMQLLSGAVDELRRSEWRSRQGTVEGRVVKHTRYALLHRPWNVTPEQRETLSVLPRANAKLFRGYLLKESFAGIYDRLLYPGWARRRVREWLAWASRSRLKPFIKVARTIRDHLEGILAFFETGFTTAHSEGNNTKARLATRQAYGFHSVDAARAMIELRCSGIEIPLPHSPTITN